MLEREFRQNAVEQVNNKRITTNYRLLPFRTTASAAKNADPFEAAVDRSAKTLTVAPDLFEELLTDVGTMVEAFAIPADSKREFLDSAKRKLAWNAIIGLRDRQRPEAALAALNGGAFDAFLSAEHIEIARDAATGALREQGNRDAARKAEAVQAAAREVGRLEGEINAGGAGMAAVTDAFAAGRIGRAARDARCRQAAEKAAEAAEKTERVEAVSRRVASDGPPLDPTAPEDVAAADLYYDETVLPTLDEQDPTARAETIGNAVVQLSVMPEGAKAFLTHTLRADDAPLRLASAEAIDRVTRERPDLAADLDPDDVAFAQAVSSARRAGLPDEVAIEVGEATTDTDSKPLADQSATLDEAIARLAADQNIASAAAILFGRGLARNNTVIDAAFTELLDRWSHLDPDVAEAFGDKVIAVRNSAQSLPDRSADKPLFQRVALTPQDQPDLDAEPNPADDVNRQGEAEVAALPLAIPIILGVIAVVGAALAAEDTRRRLRREPSVGEEMFEAIDDLLSARIAPIDLPPSRTEGPRTDMPMNNDRGEELKPPDIRVVEDLPGLEISEIEEGGIFIFPDLSEEFSQPTIVEVRREKESTKALHDNVRDIVLAWGVEKGITVKHKGGGRDEITGKEKSEFRIPGPGVAFKDPKTGKPGDSRPGSTFVDLTFELHLENGIRLLHIQSVDIDKDGVPKARELDAFKRIVSASELGERPIVWLIPKPN